MIYNIAKGFDLYDFPQSLPSDSFLILRERAFVQQAIFLEDETIKHGSSKSLVQVLTVCTLLFLKFAFHLIINYQGSTMRECHLIASGTSDKMPDIYVWEKQVGFKYTYIRELLSDY